MNDVFTSIKRTPYQSLASFLILFFTLFMTIFFFTLISFLHGVLTYIEAKPQVTVYFKTDVEEEEITKIKETVMSSDKASEVKYVSKSEALALYRKLNKDNPLLLEMVSSDILPASLEIYAKKPAFLTEIAEFLKKQPEVDEVDFQKSIVDKLLSLTAVVRAITLGIFIFLLIITFVVLMTITAFKIALKKEELELLRLLGATGWYVKKPFLAEGIFFGFFAATLAHIVFYGIIFATKGIVGGYLIGLGSVPFYTIPMLTLHVWPPNIPFIIFSYVLIVLFGVAVGLIGNLLATGKYIK
ncbi:MAG TPA: permease-like cell division protein FtsX [Patescibacteria group bacterium]|nr:permease-like cell division protein FtsX [Patescibacteria group bacterium]